MWQYKDEPGVVGEPWRIKSAKGRSKCGCNGVTDEQTCMKEKHGEETDDLERIKNLEHVSGQTVRFSFFSSGSVRRSCPKCPSRQRGRRGHPESEDLEHVP